MRRAAQAAFFSPDFARSSSATASLLPPPRPCFQEGVEGNDKHGIAAVPGQQGPSGALPGALAAGRDEISLGSLAIKAVTNLKICSRRLTPSVQARALLVTRKTSLKRVFVDFFSLCVFGLRNGPLGPGAAGPAAGPVRVPAAALPGPRGDETLCV